MRFVPILPLVLLAACATAPATNAQSSEVAGPSTGSRATSPTDQYQPSVNVGGSSVIFTPGSITPGADGKGGSVTININNGPHASADGDVKGYGKSEGAATDSGAKTSTQTPSATQSNDLSGALAAAEEFLKTVNPASEAGKLAKAAVDAANAKKLDESKALLAKAKAASTIGPGE